MTQQPNPKYRIQYRDCPTKAHEGQKSNFVCLAGPCCESSLICSLCREEQHRGHTVRPLKFYIEGLRKQYQEEQADYGREMEVLEELRVQFLGKLREAVERVAEEFRKLEEEIIERFEVLRGQIIQNQSKKNKFAEFYQSLTSPSPSPSSSENPEFLIRNYLPTRQLQALQSYEPIEQLGKKFASVVCDTREALFSAGAGDGRKEEKIETGLKFQEKLASTVTHVGNLYTQTNQANLATVQTLSALSVDFVKSFQEHKIKIRITKLKKGSYIYLGAIERQYFKSLAHKGPAIWTTPALNGKLFYFNNQAQTFGHTTSTLKSFSQGSNIEISVAGQVMKIAMKKNSAEFNLPVNGQFYFFFNLQGQAEIEMVYLKK